MSIKPVRGFLLLLASCAALGQSSQTIRIAGVANSADFQAGLPQPGSLASIFTTGLTGSGTISSSTYPLSNSLHGISVWIDSMPSPILAISFFSGYQQINVQVPWHAATDFGRATQVQVAQNESSAIIDAPQAGSGLVFSAFFIDGGGFGIVQHAGDYSLVTAESPASPGEYLVAYGINLGPVNVQLPDGTPSPFDPLAISVPGPLICSLSESIDWGESGAAVLGKSAVLFRGLTPGSVGVYQVNFQVPLSIPSGNISIRLSREVAQANRSCSGSQLGISQLTQISRQVRLPVR